MNKAKALLYQVRDEQKEINIIREQIAQAELALLPSAIRYDQDKVQSSPSDPMIRMAEKVEKYEAELQKRLIQLTDKRTRATRMIGRMKDSRYRKVLTLYFLDERHLTMEQVAKIIGYEISNTYKIRSRALRALNKRV